MEEPNEARRHFHFALLPLVMVPATWWMAIRASRAARAARDAELIARVAWARRLWLLAIVDTLIATAVAAAVLFAPRLPREVRPSPHEPRSPFEAIGGVECSEVWREQALVTLWPVLLGCALVAALWLRAWLRESNESQRSGLPRWGLVLVPLAVAPVAGIAGAYYACRHFGGWSVGVVLIGSLAQGLTMLVLGVAALALAKTELRVVVGPRLSTGRASVEAAFYMLAGLARAALLIAALWALFPQVRVGRDTSIEAILAGENGWVGRALVLAAAIGVAPVAEEVLFRGLLLPGLAQRMGTAVALLVSAAVFAAFHIPSHGPLGAILPGVLGLVFGWARLRSGGLAAPILLHATNNLLVTMLTWAG